MKVVYIGTKDPLAEEFIERMSKEGEDVYFLSDTDFSRKSVGIFRHRFYKVSSKGDGVQNVLRSISPDCVVYAGKYLMDSGLLEEGEVDLALLSKTLQVLSGVQKVKFILLSSTDVYGYTGEEMDEKSELMPEDERGIHYIRAEQLLELYRRRYNMDAIVMRTSQLYSDCAKEQSRDFLSRAFMLTKFSGGGWNTLVPMIGCSLCMFQTL